jgi:arylsulfatase A-like enzyme
VIPGERRNLPVGMPTMPEFFKQAGYSTMLIGKWHLGQEFLNMTPRHRGYDYFFGILGGALDHFSKDIGVGCGTEENDFHEVFADNCRFFNAYDLQENGVPYFDQSTFIIDLLAQKAVEQISAHDTTKSLLLSFHPNVPHAPVKAPQPYVDLCEGSSQSSRALRPHFRQKICGMVASVDVATLQIVLALHLKDMLSSSLIFYISDNGGFLEAGSSNLPYREGKGSVYEGGIHVPAFLYGHGIQGSFRSKSNLTDLFHVSDVLPTLLGYADIPTKNYKFDGYNHWNNLVLGKPLKRTRVPVNAASLAVGLYSAMIQKAFGKTWKYLFNPSVLIYAGLHPPSHGAAKYKIEGEFLFDLTSDPLETKNLIPYIDHFAHTDLEVVEVLNLLRFELLAFRSTGVASQLKKLPIDVVIHPSPGGCWLPLDSPHFLNSTCPVPPPVTPDNVFETYNLTSIAQQLDTTEEKDKDLQEMVDADGTTFAL